jgi:hypothetical protein
MVWMGTYTQSFMPSITATNARILEQSTVNLEEHVKAGRRLVAHGVAHGLETTRAR